MVQSLDLAADAKGLTYRQEADNSLKLYTHPLLLIKHTERQFIYIVVPT